MSLVHEAKNSDTFKLNDHPDLIYPISILQVFKESGWYVFLKPDQIEHIIYFQLGLLILLLKEPDEIILEYDNLSDHDTKVTN